MIEHIFFIMSLESGSCFIYISSNWVKLNKRYKFVILITFSKWKF